MDNSIKKFYEASQVFITGGSGFIGKVLIEKLLRSCPSIKTVYVLMRAKRGKAIEDRTKELVESLLFDKLREENSEMFEKIRPIEGDVMELNLGMSNADSEKLKSCSVIFHAAASVRFDDPLKSAILLNTRGTREVCNLARTMPNLKALVHVSTAYIQPKNFYVQEKTYPTEGDWQDYIKYAENLDFDLLNCMTLKLTHFAPNTYTFTKHMAEQVCIDYKNDYKLPIVIFRPSIVTASEAEPMPGWCDNFNGPMAILIGSAVGVIHVAMVKGQHHLDLIPVDICVKGMIIAAWKMWKERQVDDKTDIPIYNAASFKRVTYDSLGTEMKSLVREYPTIHQFGIPNVTFTSCFFYGSLIRLFRSIIPALLVDGMLRLSGNKPRLLKVQRAIVHVENSLEHFYSNTFNFDNFNFIDLGKVIPQHEEDEFSLKEKLQSYREAFLHGYRMSLQVLLHETPEDSVIARHRYPYIQVITKSIHLLILYAILKLSYLVVKIIYNTSKQ